MCFVAMLADYAVAVQLEPDKVEEKVGAWTLYRARWGHGCIATLPYLKNNDDTYLAVGGSRKDGLFLLLNIDPPTVGRKRADEFLESVHLPEIVLRDGRYTAEPTEYRSSVGVVIDPMPGALVSDLRKTTSLKFTENGSEKLAINTPNMVSVMEKLSRCIARN
jgi:hypothetical protein